MTDVADIASRRGSQSAEGTFALTIVPPAVHNGPPAHRRGPATSCLLLDRSGSMEGWKMVAARRAMARMIDTLGDADRFAVLAFDNQIETPLSGKPGRKLLAGHRSEPVQGGRVFGESRVAGRHRDRRAARAGRRACSARPA